MFRSTHNMRKTFGKDNILTRAIAARDDRRSELLRDRERRELPHAPELGWKVPREFVLPAEDMSDRWRQRNFGNHISLTAEFCGDPPEWRSALGGYKQRGNWSELGRQKWWLNDV